jgi:hypothetical protein
VAMPIHVIDASYRTPSATCSAPNSIPDTSPAQAGFNGILGVGVFAQDCGAGCVTETDNDTYFTCNEESCGAGASVELAAQVTNPVSLIPVDGNGISITLPAVGAGGATSVTGTMTIGVGGTSYSHSATPTVSITLKTDPNYGEFFVTPGNSFSSSNWLAGIIDSGSNFIYFNPASNQTSLTKCTGTYDGFYCSAGSFTDTNTAAICSGSSCSAGASRTETFSIVDIRTHTPFTNSVFSDVAGTLPTSLGNQMFDWGLPFFLGKTVYVGLDGQRSTLGYGPYFAY